MADNYQYINTTGTIIPDTGDILTTVQNEFKAAFGDDLDTSPATPQGLLITGETVARDAIVRNNAALANQINPNLAGGVYLDAVCALTALFRDPATRSVVTATLTGVPNTTVPAGVRAKTAAGDLFETTATVVISVGGTVDAPMRSVDFGPIPANSAALNQIVDNVLGWETITNTLAAVLGQNQQTDAALRKKRVRTLALQGVALPEAITSALYDVPEVKSLTFRENVTNAPATIDGVLMVEHSIFVCIDGGADEEIAQTILATKSLGADFNGDTTIAVIEPSSGQEYNVKFDRPDEIDIAVRATVKVVGSLLDPVTAVKDAIMDYINGDIEGEDGFVVGGSVSTWELSGAVNRYAPGIYVQNMETKLLPGGTFANTELPIEIYEVARLLRSDIAVVLV